MISAVVVCSWLGDGSWSWARTTSWGNSQSCRAGRGRWQLLADMATVGRWKPNKHLSLTFFQFFLLNHASLISTPIPGVSQQVWGLLEPVYKYLQKPTGLGQVHDMKSKPSGASSALCGRKKSKCCPLPSTIQRGTSNWCALCRVWYIMIWYIYLKTYWAASDDAFTLKSEQEFWILARRHSFPIDISKEQFSGSWAYHAIWHRCTLKH